VVLSYAAASLLFANERGAALRRAAETSVVEGVVYAAERLGEAPPEQRALLAEQIHEPRMRYSVSGAPNVERTGGEGAAARMARGIAERLPNADTRVTVRIVEEPSRRWRGAPGPEQDRLGDERPSGAPLVSVTRATISVKLGEGSWLNASVRLPGPRPAPFSLLAGALVTVFVVGLGAALVSRQIGQPLAELANAARALGSGQTHVAAAVRGPDDVRRASAAFNAMAERLSRQLDRQRQMLWALSHDPSPSFTEMVARVTLTSGAPEGRSSPRRSCSGPGAPRQRRDGSSTMRTLTRVSALGRRSAMPRAIRAAAPSPPVRSTFGAPETL
jgi:HAMP domain-containing protein